MYLPSIVFISFSTIPPPGPILRVLRKSDLGKRQIMYIDSTKDMVLKMSSSQRGLLVKQS